MVAEEVENQDKDSTEMTVAVVGVVMAVVAEVVKEGGSLVTVCGVGLKCRPVHCGREESAVSAVLALAEDIASRIISFSTAFRA